MKILELDEKIKDLPSDELRNKFNYFIDNKINPIFVEEMASLSQDDAIDFMGAMSLHFSCMFLANTLRNKMYSSMTQALADFLNKVENRTARVMKKYHSEVVQ